MRAIIYCRKSTDRDDKQAISLEHQMENCRKMAATHDLQVVEEISESLSAKTKRKRPGFNRMVSKCARGGVDYIIVDELKRLSRNTVDGSEIIELLDEHKIKGVITSGKLYDSQDHNDTMMLNIQLVFSKKENQDRAKDTKAKMETCIRNHGRSMARAPLGYKNVEISKGKKDVEVDPVAAEFVREAFKMRIEGCTFREIALKGVEMGYSKDSQPFTEQRIKKLLSNRFYCGIIVWDGKEYPGRHEPLVNGEIFDKANGIIRVFHNKGQAYRFQKLIKDEDGITLCPYEKDGKYVYYHNQRRSKRRVNVSEKRIFEGMDTYVQGFEILNSSGFAEEWRTALYRIQAQLDKDKKGERQKLLEEKIALEKRKAGLIDLFADREIGKDEYNERIADYKKRIEEIEERLEATLEDGEESREKVEKVCELVETACRRYREGNEDEKVEAIKTLGRELLATDEKAVLVKENQVFRLARLLFVTLGTISASEKASHCD